MFSMSGLCHPPRVALLAEGVDRNVEVEDSAEEAQEVALLAEGVDRNTSLMLVGGTVKVALLAEGVDRNRLGPALSECRPGRPPRGGRG